MNAFVALIQCWVQLTAFKWLVKKFLASFAGQHNVKKKNRSFESIVRPCLMDISLKF